MRLITTIFISLIAFQQGLAQGSNAPLNKDYYHLIDRLEIRGGKMAPAHQSAIKPYSRTAIGVLLNSMSGNKLLSSGADDFNATYLANDNWQWTETHSNLNPKPIWNTVYKYKSNFLYGEDKHKYIQIHVNPVLNLSIGGETADTRYTYINTRGIQVHGMIDGKVGFYTFLGENQMRSPLYVRDLSLPMQLGKPEKSTSVLRIGILRPVDSQNL